MTYLLHNFILVIARVIDNILTVPWHDKRSLLPVAGDSVCTSLAQCHGPTEAILLPDAKLQV